MKYESVADFIKKHLRFKQHWNKKIITMQDAKWQPLHEDTWIDGISFCRGSVFKVFETTNFGWIVFHNTAQTIDGNSPIRRIFKW